MAEESNDLATQVKAWLRSTGAPLEMRTAHALQLLGLDVQQAVYFNDPELGTVREIDIVAQRLVRLDSHRRVAAYLVIECKNAPTPWVVFRGAPAWDQQRPNFNRVVTTFGNEWLRLAREHIAVETGKLLQQEPRAGYAVTTTNLKPHSLEKSTSPRSTAKPPGKDQAVKDLAYAAIVSATKAAYAYADRLSNSADATTIAVLFPVVVLNGKLFETWLEGAEVTVQETDRAQVFWHSPTNGESVLVDIVTESAFRRFAEEFRETAEALVFHGKDAANQTKPRIIY